MPFSIFIVEDHDIMSEMLREYIKDVPGLAVCGAAATGEAALEALEALPAAQADLVLVDVSLPEMSGIDLVRTLHARWPNLPCLMLSGHREAAYVKRAREAGASGYVLKGDPHKLTQAIQNMRTGKHA